MHRPKMERKTRILEQKFFNRPTLVVARELLGKYLVRAYRGKVTARMITEVEAYDGLKDKGSHASRGMTKRNAVMFGEAGYWYVYFTYGMHWLVNIVTGPKDHPAAVLLRGMEGVAGPARLTKFLRIDGALTGKKADKSSGLWIEDRGIKIPLSKIKKGPRVGIDYAGHYWAAKKWRFWIDD